MDSKDYHKVCEVVDDNEPSTSKDKDMVHSVEDIVLKEISNISKDNEAGTSKTKIEIETVETTDEIETENKTIQQQFVEPLISKTNILKENESKEVFNSITLSELTTLQDNMQTSLNDTESSSSSNDQNKIKRSISKGQINSDNGILMEKCDNSSDEDSSKRQKLNENACNKLNSGGENADNAPKFHKIKSKVKKRNYRSKKALTGENGESCNEEDVEDVEMRQASEEELDEVTPACLKNEKPEPKWFMVPELLRRERGSNPLFRYRYYGSLHVVEHLELMYKLEQHQGCVNALNFNRKGNLLASGSDDLAVVIWDWAIGKKHHSFDSGHRSNVFQTKWLPFDVEYLMATSGRDGQVRLLDVRRGISRKIAKHHAPTHKLAVHPDTPHVIISAGADAKVLSIDIREEEPTELLVAKDGSSDMHLYSVQSNPLNSNEFCIGGRSRIVRIYDRRKVSTPLYNLCPDNLVGNKHIHVTCAVYNYNGTEVLASYNDEDIYLFDTMMPRIGDYAHRYQGHRNDKTVKGVNFFGPKSEYVISGSDCGNIFIWDKNTAAIVNWIAGDEQGLVNCLEPHPHIPILATSGLDFDVKIWVPSCEQRPFMEGLEDCVKTNTMERAQDNTNFISDFGGQMLRLLFRHMHHVESVRNLYERRGFHDRTRDDDDDDDDEYDDNADESSEDNNSEEEIRRWQCSPS